MPYCLVDGKSIYDKLNLPQFHLLGFSTEQNNFRALKNEIESRYSESVNFQAFFLSPEVEQAFGTNKDFGLLLRPDNHVGLISSDISSSRVREYLSESIGQ